MPNPLLITLRLRKRELDRHITDFEDLLVRVDTLGQRTPPDHPTFWILLGLYERLTNLIITLKSARFDLRQQIELLSRV